MTDTEIRRTVVEEGGNRTLVVILAVVGGLVVLALLWFLVIGPLLVSEEEPEPIVRAPRAPAEDVEPDPEPEPTPVPETFEVFTARDPFQQLATAVVATDPGGTGGGGGGGTGTPRDPTAPPADPTRPGGTDTPSGAEVGATRVRLVDVFVDDDGTDKVLVTINGTGYEVGEGEEFADRFRVLDISPPCATLLFGDSRFVLCMGEEIRK